MADRLNQKHLQTHEELSVVKLMTKALQWSFLSIPKSFIHPHRSDRRPSKSPTISSVFFLLSFLLYTIPRVHSAFVFFTASPGKDFLWSKPLTNEKSNGREVGAYRLPELYTLSVYKMKQNKKTIPSRCSRILKLWNVSQSRYKEKSTHGLHENLNILHARWKHVEGNQVQLHLVLTLELAGGALSSAQGPLCLTE